MRRQPLVAPKRLRLAYVELALVGCSQVQAVENEGGGEEFLSYASLVAFDPPVPPCVGAPHGQLDVLR